ncbi:MULTISPECIES: hypothetical protein [Pseudomonas]|uniref:hypothetical protein n=1 Tax=Pseudomonas TaxID=286 RepID=UPI0006D45721|nr:MULTISPECIES: hypothetical protein [Pseudomonas]MCE4072611.1 hypothetical protein [Pseudomonas nitritireducens]MCE4082210.1 hypothetical protein [Pseudomonas nitroreducens]OBY91528.1 hypothetical protein A6723_014270 [Pseudomonas sp. AU11447]
MQTRTLLLAGLAAALAYYAYDAYHRRQAATAVAQASAPVVVPTDAPGFMETPAQISAQSQSEIISHYRSQGYRLRCYGDLGPRERIRNDDYLCLAPISSAFADIPASQVVFFFRKERLSHVRFLFPPSSFKPLRYYLTTGLENARRLPESRFGDFGLDPSGNNLVVWRTRHGLLTATETNRAGEPVVVLWSAKTNFTRMKNNPWAK